MSELMNNILAEKLKTRKRLAALSFEEKLTMMEKMRDRERLLATNPLRKHASRPEQNRSN